MKMTAGADSGAVRIYEADWVMPITSDPIADGAVAVKDDEIVAVGPAADLRKIHPQAEITNFHHTIMLPGFVNCHSHLEYAGLRGLLDNRNFGRWILDLIDLKEELDLEDYSASSRVGALECVKSGITTVGEAMYSGASLGAIQEAGLRVLAYQEAFGLDDQRVNENLSELTDKLDRLQDEVDAQTEIGVFPHATYSVSGKFYRRIGELARERGMRIATHLAESNEESKYIRSGTGVLALDLREKVGTDSLGHEPFGVTPVKYLQQWKVFGPEFMAVHCVYVGPSDIRALAKANVSIAHCPKSNAKLGCGIAPLPAILEAGIKVGFGTDSTPSSNIMDIFDEMRTAIFLHRGVHRNVNVLSATECIQIATIGGARALGLDDRIGSLEPGKQADLIAVDMEHSHFMPIYDPHSALVYGANQEDVFFMMVAGRTLYDKKKALSLDKEKVNADALAVKKKLWHT